MVARFRFIEAKKGAWEVVKTSNGPWMQYTDHEQALAEKDREIADLQDKYEGAKLQKDSSAYAYNQLMTQAVRFAKGYAECYCPENVAHKGLCLFHEAQAFLKEH